MESITDWLMVIITSIYVVATILICFYNAKAAKATADQTEEIRTQFYTVNRPIITVEIVLIIPARGNRASGRTETVCPERGNHRYASLLA